MVSIPSNAGTRSALLALGLVDGSVTAPDRELHDIFDALGRQAPGGTCRRLRDGWGAGVTEAAGDGFIRHLQIEHATKRPRLVVYVAHPLSAPTREGIEANRKNAARWVAFLARNFHIAPECSWVVLTGELEETPENRERGLEIDLALVDRCDELWMVGGRVSSGMLLESQHAHYEGKLVVDLTGFGFGVPSGPEVVGLELDAQGSRIFEVTA